MRRQGMQLNTAYKRAYELGGATAHTMGVGLRVGIRRMTEWQRRDNRYGQKWTNAEGEKLFMAGMLSKVRHIFEVVSSGIVLATYDRRYEADAFKEGFCLKKVRSVRNTVARLRVVRYVQVLGVHADAA
jgi:hypothetical protein